MNTTTVIVNDFTNNRRSIIILNREHFDKIAEVWHDEDTILIDMQENDFFAGKTHWFELNPTHFRLMVARNLTMAAELPEVERYDSKNDVIRSLHFLLAALIYCLQQRSECLVELMRIARLSEYEVTYDFSASLNMSIEMMHKPKSGLRVVVDNE